MNRKEFEQFFMLYFKPLTAFSARLVKDLDVAKSIVHDVFVKLWEKRLNIDVEKQVKSYLFTAVNNRSLNYIRDNKKFLKTDNFMEVIENNSSVEFEDFLSAEDIKNKISKTLESLPLKCRKTFEMSRFEGKKYQEIADELGISIKTVETHISKTLKLMRKNLAEYLPILIFCFCKIIELS